MLFKLKVSGIFSLKQWKKFVGPTGAWWVRVLARSPSLEGFALSEAVKKPPVGWMPLLKSQAWPSTEMMPRQSRVCFSLLGWERSGGGLHRCSSEARKSDVCM